MNGTLPRAPRFSGMNWAAKFAGRTALMRRNTVREFLKHAQRPEVISFAGGLPAADLLPVREVGRAAESALRKFGARTLQYGTSEGLPELRQYIAQRYQSIGVTADHVLITNGAQQALDLIGRVLLDASDLVGVENPTYLALLSAWRPFNVRFEAIDPESSLFGTRDTKLLYLIPNFQNPSGTSLSVNARGRLVEAAQRTETILIEDDPYRELRFEGETLPSLLELSGNVEGPVISVGSFSKVLAPGLRLGWIIASPKVIERLVQARQAADLHTSTFTQYIAWELIQAGTIDKILPRLRSAYRMKRDRMLAALERHMPAEASWTRPEGGMFLLLSLSASIDGREVAREALENGVAVVPGEEFHVSGGENTLRLNFSNPPVEAIDQGIARLASAVKTKMALRFC